MILTDCSCPDPDLRHAAWRPEEFTDPAEAANRFEELDTLWQYGMLADHTGLQPPVGYRRRWAVHLNGKHVLKP